MRVVIIDDDVLVSMSLKTILEAEEEITVTCLGSSGEEAVQLYEKEKIEYANQKVKETAIKERTEMAMKMLTCDIDIIDIMKMTGLTETELLGLQNKA